MIYLEALVQKNSLIPDVNYEITFSDFSEHNEL
jgi:hypothetical protein